MDLVLTKAQSRLVRDNPLAARLVAKVADDEGCWIWTGSGGPHSYGFICHEGRTRKAHRVAYEVFCGAIPDGFCVCHHCDRPACINPRHLFVGRASDNMRDMLRKGRGAKIITSAQSHFKSGHAPRGEQGSGAKLTEAQALEIMRRRLAGEGTRQLAREFGIRRVAVQRLMNGQSWAHLPGRETLRHD